MHSLLDMNNNNDDYKTDGSAIKANLIDIDCICQERKLVRKRVRVSTGR
jgi:hypothetical protein